MPRMLPVTAGPSWPLFGVAASRRIEQAAAAALPPHTLMERAGLAVARLALALAPHARTVWVACGPGNNGGDGLEAAVHLHAWGKRVVLTLAGDPDALPVDAANAWRKVRQAGLSISTSAPPEWDLGIDALLGIGSSRPLSGAMAEAARQLNAAGRSVLSVDVPSGLSADCGTGESVRAAHTLALLTLKPGLFTAQGRDAAGQVWFDDLGVAAAEVPVATLVGAPPENLRRHASHKGSYGDVAVIGGAAGMAGAAVLAATAALHAGAGRVFLVPLAPFGPLVDAQPELMVRDPDALPLEHMAVACGCGGGTAVASVLGRVLARSGPLVLDADALNAIASDTALQQALVQRSAAGKATVLTPHPLEAARLLGADTAAVQADRLHAAQELSNRYGCTMVLKGSGTVIAAPGALPAISPTGNARLATAGTGDVLAGMVAAALAAGGAPRDATLAAVYRHGLLADRWPAGRPLTAGALARLAP